MTADPRLSVRLRVARAAVAAIAVLAAGLLGAPRALAITVPLTLSERVSLSSSVFLATVGSHSSAYHGRGIVTGVRVRPAEVLKGRAPGQVALMGGKIGRAEEIVTDQPELKPGSRYLFFLDPLGRPIGGPQGAIEVRDGKLVPSGVPLSDVAGAVAAATLAPQQAQAFPELRGTAGRAAALARVDSAIEAAASAATTATAGAAGAASAGPAVTAISPEEVAAGIGTTVEIDGAGFGPTPGQISVVYDPQGGIARWPVSPTTWSSTRITFRVPVFIDSGNYPGSAGTGPVRITTSSGEIVDTPAIHVTYAFDGDHWATTPVPVYVNPNGTASPSATLTMVENAISTWADGGFPLAYGGVTSNSGSSIHGNGINEIIWGSLPAGILAQSSWYPDPNGSGHLTEQNVVFNTQYSWTDGSTSTSYDVQSIALHELGHWIVLRDQYSPNDSSHVMYGYGYPGRQKRSLTTAELDGVRYVYGSDQTAPVTSVAVTSSAGFINDWTSGDVTMTVTPPGDVNLRATRYRVDYGPAQVVSGVAELPFTAEGRHDVMYWSTDNADNNETPRHTTIAIDRTAPTSSSDARVAYAGQATLRLTGSDALSGVSQLQWRFTGSDTWTSIAGATGTTTFSTPGSYTLEYRAVDRAGNAEEPHVVAFNVLPQLPAAIQLKTASHNVTYGTRVTIDGTLTTSGLGLAGQTVRLQSSSTGNSWKTAAIQTTGSDGRFGFVLRATATAYYRVTYSGALAVNVAYAAVPNPPSVRIGSTAYMPNAYASRVRARTYDLWTSMMPRHVAGTYPVRIYLWRWRGGAWVSYGSVAAKAYDSGTSSTKALRRYVFVAAGTWRIRAYHADAGHLPTWSAYRTLSVP